MITEDLKKKNCGKIFVVSYNIDAQLLFCCALLVQKWS